MSMTFTKLFSSITESTIWTEADTVRLVWITMLAMADSRGRVWASIPGLANRARVSVADCESAINRFLSPDKYSRTADFEGRRIEVIDGGWRLLNHSKYRAIRDEEAIKESKRKHINTKRALEKENKLSTVDRGRHNAEAEAEAEAEVEKNESVRAHTNGKFVKPTVDEVKERFIEIDVPSSEAEFFMAHYESNGWKVGRNPMKSWKAACVNWKKTMRLKSKPRESFI